MTPKEFENRLLEKGFIIDISADNKVSGYTKSFYRYMYNNGDSISIYSLGGYLWVMYYDKANKKEKSLNFNSPEEVLKFIEE